MKTRNKKSKSGSQFGIILLIFFLPATLMLSSALIELQQSKKELYQLMSKQAHSLLESLIIASQNSLRATTYLDELSEQRLMNNAGLIKRLYEKGRVTNQILNEKYQRSRTRDSSGWAVRNDDNGEPVISNDPPQAGSEKSL